MSRTSRKCGASVAMLFLLLRYCVARQLSQEATGDAFVASESSMDSTSSPSDSQLEDPAAAAVAAAAAAAADAASAAPAAVDVPPGDVPPDDITGGGGLDTSHYGSYGRPEYFHSRRYCSCANPVSVPLNQRNAWCGTAATEQISLNSFENYGAEVDAVPDDFEATSYYRSWWHSISHRQHNYNWYPYGRLFDFHFGRSPTCTVLPTVSSGQFCGAGIGICASGLCCSQTGICSNSDRACDGTCQCKYSGEWSRCKGAFPFAAPYPWQLPVVQAGGGCGTYLGVCPSGQCCSQFGFCVPDGSQYCNKPSCKPFFSPNSKTCLPPKLTAKSPKRQTWVVTWKTLALDGFPRPVLVTNGEPFRTLIADVGDQIIVTVVNKLDEPLSIHFHGVLQRQTNIMDGPAPTTQRPVMPGESFTYNFLAEHAGVSWWHSHYHAQYIDGLSGQVVIRDPTEPSYPADRIVVLRDWYHTKSEYLLEQFIDPDAQGSEPTPDNALLNLHGQGACEKRKSSRGKAGTKAGKAWGSTACQYSYIQGVASSCDNPKTRLRVINAGGIAVFNMSIDNHRMIVIAQDGVLVEPVEVGSLTINNGQRYEVLACQRGQKISKDPVWIRATIVDEEMLTPARYNKTKGVLYFTDKPPTTLPTSQEHVLPPHLSPETDEGIDVMGPYGMKALGNVAPPASTRTITLNIEMYGEDVGGEEIEFPHLNKVSLLETPESVSLLERLSNNPEGLGPPENAKFGRGWHILDIALGEVIDVVINNSDPGEHPIHMHGHLLWIMAFGQEDDGPYKGQPLKASLARDTITVNANSYLVLRFVADSPGVWFLHCHIDWHLAAGMGLLFKEGFPKA